MSRLLTRSHLHAPLATSYMHHFVISSARRGLVGATARGRARSEVRVGAGSRAAAGGAGAEISRTWHPRLVSSARAALAHLALGGCKTRVWSADCSYTSADSVLDFNFEEARRLIHDWRNGAELLMDSTRTSHRVFAFMAEFPKSFW